MAVDLSRSELQTWEDELSVPARYAMQWSLHAAQLLEWSLMQTRLYAAPALLLNGSPNMLLVSSNPQRTGELSLCLGLALVVV